MKPLIKPIETQYQGYKFRSRLEARWAVFFHNYGIDFEYELEGFKMPSGQQYLPDFFLPKQNVFVEVKPTKELNDIDIKKMLEFSVTCDRILLLVIGTPTKEEMFIVSRRTAPEFSELEEYLCEGQTISDAFIESLSDAPVCFSPLPTHAVSDAFIVYKELPPYDDNKRAQALLAAKQARFEFNKD